jgi:hypothetical protein
MVGEPDGSVQGTRRKTWLWVALAAVVAIVIAIVVYFAVTAGSSNGAMPTTSPSPSASASSSAPADGTDPSTQPTPDPSATPGTMPELAPVAPDEPSDNGEGLVAEITAMKAVQGEAVQAGEIAGPAVQFTLRLTNDTDAAIDLGLIAVNAYIGEALTPAGGLVKPGAAPFEGTLAVGDSTDGVYVYSIPEDQRGDVTLTLDYRAGQPAFVFRGKVG